MGFPKGASPLSAVLMVETCRAPLQFPSSFPRLLCLRRMKVQHKAVPKNRRAAEEEEQREDEDEDVLQVWVYLVFASKNNIEGCFIVGGADHSLYMQYVYIYIYIYITLLTFTP